MSVTCEPFNIDLGDGAKNWGAASYSQRRIRLSQKQPDSEILDTFLHEIMHLIFDDKGLTNYVGEDTEFLVSTISSGLTDVLYENPKLVDYIKERVNE